MRNQTKIDQLEVTKATSTEYKERDGCFSTNFNILSNKATNEHVTMTDEQFIRVAGML